MATLEIQKVDLASFCYFNKERYPFLLESVNHNENNRYSILFAFPEESIVLQEFSDFDFLNELESQFKTTNHDLSLPFTGGWFVYLSYELIGQIETTLASKLHKSNIPIAYAVKIPCAVITDHQLGKTFVFDEADNKTRINQILSDISYIENIPDKSIEGKISEESNEKFTDGVNRSLRLYCCG